MASSHEALIRLAIPGDLGAIKAIVEAAYSPYIPRIGRPPGPMLDDYEALIAQHRIHVLELERHVIGLIVLIPEAGALLLDNVALSPDHQNRGFGRQLMAFAERKARELGYHSINLYTNEAMTENIALYQRLGYIETRRVTEKNFNRVFMRKTVVCG